jgi:hypothetical protein
MMKEDILRVPDARITPCFVPIAIRRPRRRSHRDVNLVVDSSCPLKEVPVKRSSSGVEGGGEDHGDGACRREGV